VSRSVTTFKKGYIPSQETKDKIRKSLIGRKLTEEHKKNIQKANAGKCFYKMTDKTRAKISKSLTGISTRGRWKINGTIRENMSLAKIGKYTGEKHWNWIKDRSLLKDDSKERGGQFHKEWSRLVKIRDKWKCKILDEHCNGRIEAHHILSWRDYPELRFNINNGIALCHAHHPRKRAEEKRLSLYFMDLVSVSK